MKRALLLAVILALGAGIADAKQCKDPKTGKFVKCPPAAAATTTTTTSSSSSSSHPPHCVKGVPCGNTCIAKGKVCHKS
jgi:hypothetical protein